MRIEQEIIASDMMNMDQVLSHATIMEKSDHPMIVEQGTKVTYVQGDTGVQTEVTLVDPLEADPSEGFISVNSPVGSMLLGHHINDTVSITTPKGTNQLTIVGLE
jgi:transcription elongation factor GreA